MVPIRPFLNDYSFSGAASNKDFGLRNLCAIYLTKLLLNSFTIVKIIFQKVNI